MISFLKRLKKDRRGNALVIGAAALPLLIGSAGLATDTIQWALWKRQLQRTADSAALAGVRSIVQNPDVEDAAIIKTIAVAGAERDLQVNSHVGMAFQSKSIENMPLAGAYTTDPNAVRVALSIRKRLGFSSLFLSAAPTITVTATATVATTGKYCVISLENTTTTGITYTGNANVDLGCGMATNSTGTIAIDATGSSTVDATPISAVGGIPPSTNFQDGTTLQPYGWPQKDPFADIDPPVPSGGCPPLNVQVNDAPQTVSVPANASFACFNSMNIQGTLTLNPGTYVIDGGDFRVGAQASVTCARCTIILTNRNSSTTASIGRVDIQGSPYINMTAPNDGSTYSGILFYQDRRARDGNGENYINHVSGSSTSVFEGAFYFPKQQVYFNGTTGMTTNCVQMVARRVQFSGNTSITNVCPPGPGAKSFDGSSIRLVE